MVWQGATLAEQGDKAMRSIIMLTAAAIALAGCQTTAGQAGVDPAADAAIAEAEAMRRSNALTIACNAAGQVTYTYRGRVIVGTTLHSCEQGETLPVLARAHNFGTSGEDQLLLIEGPIPGFPNYGAVIRAVPGAAPVLLGIDSLESFGEVRDRNRITYRHGGLNPRGEVYLITSEITFDWTNGGRIASERQLGIQGTRN